MKSRNWKKVKYKAIMRENLVTLFAAVSPHIRVITIHCTNTDFDTEFYERQGWQVIYGRLYPGLGSETLTCTTQEEVNQALLVAEVTDRLSINN